MVNSPLNFFDRLHSYGYAIADLLKQEQPLWLLTDMPGNIGDHLIWAGVERLFDISGIVFNRISVQELTELEKQPSLGTLVIPGSGAFTLRWHEWLPLLVISASKKFTRIVILPSEYETTVPIVQEALSLPNVYSLAREVTSYKLIKDFGRSGLALDPALYAFDFQLVSNIKRKDKKSMRKLLALRTDEGSLYDKNFQPNSNLNNDISLTTQHLDDFLNVIELFDIIITDRLHVFVASIMKGKQVYFINPCNEKISRYIRYNFHENFADQIKQCDLNWLIEEGYVEEKNN
jgi:exopolysaccharide biosynthesis predicted pyruvyltransferase EpsI